MRDSDTFLQLFDATATPSPWAVDAVRNFNAQQRVTSVFAGKALWQHLTGQCLVKAAGILPPSVLHNWRKRLVDNRDNLARLASAWQVPPCWKIAADQWPPALLYVVSRNGSDLAAALAWLARILAPAATIARDQNKGRLAEVAAAGPPTPPAQSRTRDVLKRLAERNRVSLTNATRVDDPYSMPKEPPPILSTAHLSPGQTAMIRLLLSPGLSATLLASVQTALARAPTDIRLLSAPPDDHTYMDIDPPSSPSSPPRKRARRSSEGLRPPLVPIQPDDAKRYPCPDCPEVSGTPRLFTSSGLHSHGNIKHGR
ncbi:hypothetical protein B0H16DRAFT_234966 [Mycena metata]|uniref:Uncharacterized protein n=1 Tax=Mycena metata TaxID=1033252 RepID=A0AAD7JQL3_9AGAR|nr:hypothetical protein B0H16DRAFT_234966 [Mycena metata]